MSRVVVAGFGAPSELYGDHSAIAVPEASSHKRTNRQGFLGNHALRQNPRLCISYLAPDFCRRISPKKAAFALFWRL